MNIKDILALPSMPMTAPTYPKGPFRFYNREYMIITYQSDPDAIRAALPEPLEPDGSDTVMYEFIKMPDSAGFGSYTESGIVIPCLFQGTPVNFTAQMYLDDEAPISGGREIWGFPKKFAFPKLEAVQDTLVGTLDYGGIRVAIGTMTYKHQHLTFDLQTGQATDNPAFLKKLGKTQINLKIIPDVDGSPLIAQLVGYELQDIILKGAWQGAARLHLVPHVNAPVADLPVRQVVGGLHFVADLTLPYGRVLWDYKS
jgi:acetoacetate decarboxylase